MLLRAPKAESTGQNHRVSRHGSLFSERRVATGTNVAQSRREAARNCVSVACSSPEGKDVRRLAEEKPPASARRYGSQPPEPCGLELSKGVFSHCRTLKIVFINTRYGAICQEDAREGVYAACSPSNAVDAMPTPAPHTRPTAPTAPTTAASSRLPGPQQSPRSQQAARGSHGSEKFLLCRSAENALDEKNIIVSAS